MTRDELVRLAREAGFGAGAGQVWTEHREGICTEELERFAALVRADEREACARVCEEMHLLHFAGPWKKQAAAIRARSKK